MRFYRRDDHGVRYYESEADPSPGIAGFEIETPRNGYGWQVRVIRSEIIADDFQRDNRLAGREFSTLREAKAACESHAWSDASKGVPMGPNYSERVRARDLNGETCTLPAWRI